MSRSHRILLINQYAGSPRDGMEFRPHALAREWQAEGHDVLIVAGSPSHVRARNPELAHRVSREVVDGVEFEWLRLPRYDGNGARRAANIVAFASYLRTRSRALADDFRPDVVIASSTHPLDIYGARAAARRSGAHLVFEVHDLWPLTPIELGGMSPAHPFIRLMARAERDACASADTVVSILPAADRHLVTRGMPPERYVHVPNGISIAEADAGEPLPAEQAELVRSLRAEGRFLVGYAGGIGLVNAIDDLLAAATLLRAAPVTFMIWGDGPERLALERQAAEAGLTHVRFLGRIPKQSGARRARGLRRSLPRLEAEQRLPFRREPEQVVRLHGGGAADRARDELSARSRGGVRLWRFGRGREPRRACARDRADRIASCRRACRARRARAPASRRAA